MSCACPQIGQNDQRHGIAFVGFGWSYDFLCFLGRSGGRVERGWEKAGGWLMEGLGGGSGWRKGRREGRRDLESKIPPV